MTDDHFAFGLRIRSDLALPELTPADNSDHPCVLIRLGEVTTTIPGARRVGPTVQVGDGDFLLDVPEVARYRVRGGAEIIVDPARNASCASAVAGAAMVANRGGIL